MLNDNEFYVLKYINGNSYLAIYKNIWTLTYDLRVAKRFGDRCFADIALQALLQEARDRMREKDTNHIWFNMGSGLVSIVKVRETFSLEEVND